MQQHEAHGSSQTEITTGSTGQLEALVGLIRSDAFAMTFQSVKQYREALINAAAAVQGEPAPCRCVRCERCQEAAKSSQTGIGTRIRAQAMLVTKSLLGAPIVMGLEKWMPPRSL